LVLGIFYLPTQSNPYFLFILSNYLYGGLGGGAEGNNLGENDGSLD
jgi:hypothetical protein